MRYKRNSTFRTAFTTYTVDNILGEGGAGTVYAVRDADGGSHALKVLAASKASSSRVRRFKNEIRFCASQRHKNIISVTDHGITKADEPFYVMPLYSATLRRLLEKGIDSAAVLRLFAQMLDGVEAAHLQGVFHRDLKPENILVQTTNGDLVIADFGIAHFEMEDLLTAVETRNQERLANFLYAAPEQRIRGQNVDGRADIYALGLILNEMFTGAVPQGTAFRRITNAAPDSSYVDDVVDLMLRQDPEDRIASVDAVKRELIARGDQFIALQRLNKARTEVIPETDVDDPVVKNPIRIESVDYKNGALFFKLSSAPPSNWVMEFKNPRSNFSYFPGKEPANFGFDKDTVFTRLDHDDARILANYVKSYVEMANKQYAEKVNREHLDYLANERNSLRQRIAEEERREEILKSIEF